MNSQPKSEPEARLPRDLAAPARRALEGAGIQRLDQLTSFSEKEISRLHGIGPRAITQLRDALAQNGLSFAGGKKSKAK